MDAKKPQSNTTFHPQVTHDRWPLMSASLALLSPPKRVRSPYVFPPRSMYSQNYAGRNSGRLWTHLGMPILNAYVATDWSLSCFPQLFRKHDTLRAQHALCAFASRLGNDRRLANKNPDNQGNSSINLLPRSMGFISRYLVVGSQFPKALILAQYEGF